MGNIVWLASYPKSGNTWLRALLHNLLRNPEEPFDINRMSELTMGDSQAHWFKRFDDRPATQLSRNDLAGLRPKVHRLIAESAPESVLVKTHSALIEVAGVSMITREVTAAAIYVVRNPLDVALSYAHHLGSSIDDIIALMATTGFETPASETHVPEHHGDWSTNVRSWTQVSHPALHVARYEDMSSQPEKTFGAVAKFLGISPASVRLEKAIRSSSFRELRAQEKKGGFVERTPAQDRFFRSGKAGGWRKALTDNQVRRIVERHREQMERFDYVPAGY